MLRIPNVHVNPATDGVYARIRQVLVRNAAAAGVGAFKILNSSIKTSTTTTATITPTTSSDMYSNKNDDEIINSVYVGDEISNKMMK